MLVYLFNIALILLWGILLIYRNPTKQKRKIFCIIASIQWILVSGLRGISVGADTDNYGLIFNNVNNMTFGDVWSEFVGVYLYGQGAISGRDPGYLVFQKLIHIFITSDYQVYLIIVAIIIFASLGYFVYKNSKDACFSFILFSCLFYSFYAITGIRQALATALIVFIGSEFIKKKRLIPFLIISLIAFTLHKSALVFVPFYFLGNKKITKTYLIVLGVITAVLFALGGDIIIQIASFFGYEREENYILTPTTYIILMSAIGVATLVFLPKIKERKDYNNIETNGVLLSVCFTLLTILDQSMMRVQQYYALYMMFSIPSIINVFDKKNGWFFRVACIGALIFLLIQNNPQYVFFWQ